jgi:hypothetical protein
MNNSKSFLDARASVAVDLFQSGEITRREMFRLEMDAALLENTGDVKYEKNTDFEDHTM